MADREPLKRAEIRARKPQKAPVGSVTVWLASSEARLMRQTAACLASRGQHMGNPRLDQTNLIDHVGGS
jgi:hypothetical protein